MVYMKGVLPNQKYVRVYHGRGIGTFGNMFKATALSAGRNMGQLVKSSGKSLLTQGHSLVTNKNLQNTIKSGVMSVGAPLANVGLQLGTEIAKAKILNSINDNVRDDTLNQALSNVVAKAPVVEAVTQIAKSSSPEDIKHNVKQLVEDTKEYARREGKEIATKIAEEKGNQAVEHFAPVVLNKVADIASNAGIDQARLNAILGYGLKKKRATRRRKTGGMLIL